MTLCCFFTCSHVRLLDVLLQLWAGQGCGTPTGQIFCLLSEVTSLTLSMTAARWVAGRSGKICSLQSPCAILTIDRAADCASFILNHPANKSYPDDQGLFNTIPRPRHPDKPKFKLLSGVSSVWSCRRYSASQIATHSAYGGSSQFFMRGQVSGVTEHNNEQETQARTPLLG
jgi:hypothetical protein